MKDVEAKLDRAKAILRLIDKLGRQLPESLSEEERTAQAAGHLDEQLGKGWRKEVKRAGLEVPGSAAPEDMHKRQGIDCMYEKIKGLLEENGEHGEVESRLPFEDEEEEEIEHSGVKKIDILIMGK